jgi:hypothetical protein
LKNWEQRFLDFEIQKKKKTGTGDISKNQITDNTDTD